MRRKRVLGGDVAYYHCMSRMVGGEHLLGIEEKEVLRKMLWQVADFCGARVLTYAVMSNHFHVFVRMQMAEAVNDAELVRRYAVLYGDYRAPWQPKPEVLEALLREDGADGKRWRRELLARMGDVSAFMKTLKQRFSVWFNKNRARYGTLWADRFKSVLVQGSPRSLAMVAAYIDLNPVRAGLADDPAQYRWCGYSEAMAGHPRAREGLLRVFHQKHPSWDVALFHYRKLIFGIGQGGRHDQIKISRERTIAVMRTEGTVQTAEALRCRIRYFTDGLAIGSRGFIRQFVNGGQSPPNHSGPSPLPITMPGSTLNELCVAGQLRGDVFN